MTIDLDDIEAKARELAAEHPGPYRAGGYDDHPGAGDFVLYGAEPGDLVLHDEAPALVRYLAALSPDVVLELVRRVRAAEKMLDQIDDVLNKVDTHTGEPITVEDPISAIDVITDDRPLKLPPDP